MSEGRLSTRKIAVFVVFIGVGLAALAATFGLGTANSSAACTLKDGTHFPFQAADDHTAAPDTAFKDANGKDRRLTDYKGQGVVLNFWATWCAPCVREMPQLDRLRALLKGTGINVLAVSEDRKGVPVAKKFFETNKLHDLEVLVDPGGKLLRSLKVRGLPTTVLFGEDGLERGRVTGIAEWDSNEVVAFIRKCLGA